MAVEDDGNLEDILTQPPQVEDQGEAVNTEVQADSPQLQAGEPTQVEAAASSLPASLMSRAQAAGLQLDGISSADQLAEQVLDRYLQDRAYAEYGRSSLAGNGPNRQPNQPDSQDGGETDPVEEAFDEQGHFSNLWNVPALDDACKYAIQNGLVVLGEDGIFQAKPGMEAHVLPLLQTINQSHLSQKELVGKLFEGNFYQNVDKGLWPAFESRLNRMLDERLNGRFSDYQKQVTEQSFVDKFVTDNKAWLYDATGNNLSADGIKFQQTVEELRKNGITDPQVLANYAIKIAGINTHAGSAAQATATGQPAGQGQPAPNSGKARDEHGRFLPAGTPAPVPQKTKQESFLDKARRSVTNSDSRSGGLNSGADYQISNEAELENLFSDAWKQAAVA